MNCVEVLLNRPDDEPAASTVQVNKEFYALGRHCTAGQRGGCGGAKTRASGAWSRHTTIASARAPSRDGRKDEAIWGRAQQTSRGSKYATALGSQPWRDAREYTVYVVSHQYHCFVRVSGGNLKPGARTRSIISAAHPLSTRRSSTRPWAGATPTANRAGEQRCPRAGERRSRVPWATCTGLMAHQATIQEITQRYERHLLPALLTGLLHAGHEARGEHIPLCAGQLGSKADQGGHHRESSTR